MLADYCLVALRQQLDEFIGERAPCRLGYLLFARARFAIGDNREALGEGLCHLIARQTMFTLKVNPGEFHRRL